MNDSRKNLTDYTKEELRSLSPDQVQQLFIETLKEFVEVSESAAKHINQLDEYRKQAEQSGNEQMANELGLVAESTRSHLTDGMISCGKIVKEIETEDAKTLSIFNQVTSNRGQAFVETMSEGARAHDEYMQARRDERYEQMIQEAGEVESPVSRLHQ